MTAESSNVSKTATYSYLGPIGTFTELALAQVPEAAGASWRAVSHVQDAIDDVLSGASVGAVIPVENSIEGGVSATLDALAADAKIRIVGEYLVPVTFDLVARPGTKLADVHTVATQTHGCLGRHFIGSPSGTVHEQERNNQSKKVFHTPSSDI